GQAPIFTTTTTAEGNYVFTGVQPGKYDLVIEARGFAMAKVEVEVSPIRETAMPPIKLSVAGVTESVAVVAASAQVQTANAEMISTITKTQIETLPLVDRSIIELATTQPGAFHKSFLY